MFMNFIPDKEMKHDIPYFEDVSTSAGWAGQATSKPEEALMAEVAAVIGRLGGAVYQWQKGSFGMRYGYRLHFHLQGGKPGRIDVISLPLKTKISAKGYEQKKSQAVKMALYNLRDQLESLWRMQQLVPGYFGLLPLMLVDSNHTFGEAFLQTFDYTNLLPAPVDEETVDAEFINE